MEYETREIKSRNIRKDLAGCVQDVFGKNKLLIKFKYGE